MRHTLAVRREVAAFYGEMVTQGKAETIYDDVVKLRKGIANLNKFDQAMVVDRIPAEEKVAFLKETMRELDNSWVDFFIEMAYAYEFKYLSLIINSYIDNYERNLLTIESVVLLTDKEIETIQRKIEHRLNHRFNHINHVLNQDLLGGVLVRSRDYLLDGTLLKDLNDIKRSLNRN
ncbi:F0F1 ATP synthase subunit delta [Atopobacter phocae]|uniref:F0F1 ATP synthase subunit delta n=1 Tax=Atopobacter phocae TaxID=136492 RepID=UPI00046FA253|nr:F0F1 ATP synthase subunit delta [Atopobacter phocae]